MSSSWGSSAFDGGDHDNRVFTVEGCPGGDSPATPRKRLHSAEEAQWSSRPPPEGAGSVPISESEEKGGFCQSCQKKVSELKKQALALADQNSLKDPGMQPSCSSSSKLLGIMNLDAAKFALHLSTN
uniref:kinesin-like protein KIF26A n=1 Tax=Maylandia zebra TaxID=106582 RepID=UPI000D2FACDE|nr:kinesin-like protein KIF26A [Maylandia zebra]